MCAREIYPCDVISCVVFSGNMEESAKKRVCGKYWVAGGLGQVSCSNTSLTTGISMHLFPSNECLRRQWTKFVRKHRPCFKPWKTSVICSVHFLSDCFSRRLDLSDNPNVSVCRRLEKVSIPTIDIAVKPPDNPAMTDRDRRMVSSYRNYNF